MAEASGLGRTTIQQIWGAFGLQPHRAETFKLSTDPLLIDKVRATPSLQGRPRYSRCACHTFRVPMISRAGLRSPVQLIRLGASRNRTSYPSFLYRVSTRLVAWLTSTTGPRCRASHAAARS